MPSPHTSLPRWPDTDPGVDRAGRSYAVLSFGPGAETVAARWRAELATLGRPAWFRHAESLDPAPVEELAEQLARARVGQRLMLAGPQIDVLSARAAAVRAGLLDSEIRIMTTGDAHRRVWCSHCGTTSVAEVATGSTLPCTGCDRSLLVYHHVSRRTATYLGFMVDAEEAS